MILNLDPNFQPYGKGYEFKSWLFNGGEVGFKLSDEAAACNYAGSTITCRLINSDRVMELLMATDALKRAGHTDISLTCPYFPYGRQDRVMTNGESLSLKVFCDLINRQKYREVRVFNAHSDVSPALLDNIVNVSDHNFVKEAFKLRKLENDDYWLVAPDGGSLKRIHGVAKAIDYHDLGLIKCDKERNVENGRILSTSVNRDNLNGWDAYIVDDIAEKATTFTEIAKQLKQRNCGKIYLIVSHGIFPAGYSLEGIEHCYTTNSFREVTDDPKITTIKLDTALLM